MTSSSFSSAPTSMKTNPLSSTRRAAFTLLEMAIVLAILALVTHVAVTRLVDDTYKPRLARRQLAELRDAICGREGVLDAAGQPTWTGFVADMGRLPSSVGELWSCPTNQLSRMLPVPDSSHRVWSLPCGWNGPYAKPASDGRLLDPWGNSYRLDAPSGGDTVRIVSSGPDGVDDDGAGDDLAVTNVVSASLDVSATFYRWGASGTNDVPLFLPTDEFDGRDVAAHVYGPDTSGGRCEIRTWTAQPAGRVTHSCASYAFDGLVPGAFVLVLEEGGSRKGVPHPLVLKPGRNRVVLSHEVLK